MPHKLRRRAEALGCGYEARLRGLAPFCRQAKALGCGYEARLRGLAMAVSFFAGVGW